MQAAKEAEESGKAVEQAVEAMDIQENNGNVRIVLTTSAGNISEYFPELNYRFILPNILLSSYT